MEESTIFQRLRREIDWKDWRVKWVIGSILISFLATVMIYFLVPLARDVSTFRGAIFASWVSGLVLTIAITLVITIAQFARPDQEVFEARARNLLRRQTGPHIDYIIPKLQKLLEPYCDEVVRTMVIAEFDEPSKLFRVNQHTLNKLKSYLNDMPVTFESKLAYENGTPAPAGREQCTLTYLKVAGEPIGGPEEFSTMIERPFEMRVLPYETCEIDHRMVCWVKEESEPNRHIPRRFTRSLSVIVHNQLHSKKIVIAHQGGEQFVIEPGFHQRVVTLRDLEPGEPVYDFRIKLG